MKTLLHPMQQQLLDLAANEDITKFSLGQLAKRFSVSAQIIKHHWQQLDKKGLLAYHPQGIGEASLFEYKPTFHLLTIPVLGRVTAGPLQIFADENIAGYLRISSSLRKDNVGLFAVKVSGESMNKAMVGGKLIKEGSHVIVNSEDKGESGAIVVAVIDGYATVKQLEIGDEWVKFNPVSTKTYQPVILSKEEGDAHVCGRVIEVY